MSAKLDAGLLRQVGLTAFDINTIGVLVKSGGEAAWYPNNVKPFTRQMIDAMIKKGLVEITSGPTGGQYLRLTDLGRQAATQIEAMNVAPKVEVNRA